MSCRRMQRRISDAVDGEISPRRRQRLEAHLARCAECREYARRLHRIHAEIPELRSAAPTPEEEADFAARLERRLQAEGPLPPASSRAGVPLWLRWAAPSAAAAAVALLLMLPRIRGPVSDPEDMTLTMESTVRSVLRAHQSDPSLSDLFDHMLLESLGDDLDQVADAIGPLENPLIWEELTQEELEYLEGELAKDVKSWP